MTDLESRRAALDNAIAKAGGVFAFRAALGVTHQAVYAWKKRGSVPLERAAVIEALYGVPRCAILEPRIARALETSTADTLL